MGVSSGRKARTFVVAALTVTAAALYGCGPSPRAAAPKSAAPAAGTAAPPPPARMMKMICRDSQTGASVACGTPNAVMVGMKPE